MFHIGRVISPMAWPRLGALVGVLANVWHADQRDNRLRDDLVKRGGHRACGDDGGHDARREVPNPCGCGHEQRDHHPAQGQTFGRLIVILGSP